MLKRRQYRVPGVCDPTIATARKSKGRASTTRKALGAAAVLRLLDRDERRGQLTPRRSSVAYRSASQRRLDAAVARDCC
jgi:hypothetical protein